MEIRLLFTSQRKMGAKLIEWFTWGDYAHVDFVHPTHTDVLVGARYDGGVKYRDRHVYTYSKVLEASVDLPGGQEQADALWSFVQYQIGRPYDWGAILGFPFRASWHDDRKWFCSELVAEAFSRVGLPLVSGDRHFRITPRDLLLSPRVVRHG
jgi:hypothetical protein